MKILVVGGDFPWSIEKIYLKYWEEKNIDVKLFTALNTFYDYYYKSVFNKLKHRAKVSNIFKKINKELLLLVEEYQPTIVFVLKGMEVFPNTLLLLKQKGIKLVNYNPDNPYIFTGYGSGNSNVTKSITLFDLYLTYDTHIAAQLAADGVKADILPFGFDLSPQEIMEASKEKEVIKTCFIGNPDNDRVHFLNSLAAENIEIDVYGNNWEKFKLHQNITKHASIYKEKFWRTLYKYRVQLNIMRIHNPNSHNMRSFEIPGIGGIMVAPKTIDHQHYFEDGKEVFLFDNVGECKNKIEYVLALSDAEAKTIRNNVSAKSQAAGYSYQKRSAQLLKYFANL